MPVFDLPTPDHEIEVTSPTEIQAAVNNHWGEATIKLPGSTVTMPNTLTIPSDMTGSLVLQGQGKGITILDFSSGLLDLGIQSLKAAYTGGYLFLKDLTVKINTKDAATIGIDSEYLTLDMENVTVQNTNATKRGIGIKASPVMNNGGGVWKNVSVFKFGTNFYIAQDHILGLWTFSEDPADLDYYVSGSHDALVLPQAFRSADNVTTAKRFQIGGGARPAFYKPFIEKNSGGAIVFERVLGGAEVYDMTTTGSFTDPIVSVADMQYIKFFNSPDFITRSEKYGTFAIDSTGLKTIVVAHGLSYTPLRSEIQVSVTYDTAVTDWRYDSLLVSAIDGTNVTVKVYVSTASGTGGAIARAVVKCQARAYGS